MGRRIPPSLCARCKGYKRLCGLPTCPILEKFRVHASLAPRISGESLEGDTPPSVIVGEKGYPSVPVLVGIPPGVHGEEARGYDDPPGWASRREPLSSIVRLRSSLVSPILRARVEQPWRLYEQEISLAAVSEKPVDSEAELAKKPIPSLRFDGILSPQGPSAPARRLRVTSNPRPPRPLEKLFFDDVAAQTALEELYMRHGLDVYSLVPALSLGLLGRTRSRRLVPTRWAITAVDQAISNILLSRLGTSDTIDKYEVYHGGYLGNYFTVILAPEDFQAELIEVWHPLTPWTRDASKPVVYRINEYTSRRQSVMDGGYIAVRLAVAEHLHRRGRQAAAIIVREITREYYAPVGNWHIRETMRRVLSSKPVAVTDTLGEAIAAAMRFLRSQAAAEALRGSRLTAKLQSQLRLDAFLPGGWERRGKR